MSAFLFIASIDILEIIYKNKRKKDSSDNPGIMTSPSNTVGAGPILGQGDKTPHAPQPKKQNRNNIVTNSIQIFFFNKDFLSDQ